MNERDERLGKLIEAVRQHPSGSLSWRKSMNQLLIEIQQLPGLARSAHPDYLEALDDTLLKLGDEIHEFEPRHPSLEKSLVAWINLKLRLKYEVRDLHSSQQTRAKNPKNPQAEFQEQLRKPPLSLDVPLGDEGSETFGDRLAASVPCTLLEIEAQTRREQEQRKNQRIGVQLKQYIDRDPEGKLRRCHPQAYPECNCQILSQRLLLKYPPDKLALVARDLNINYNTLNWHWKNKGLPLLQAIARNLGYQPNVEDL
ncbi:MAG: hypothetical protein AB1861_23170 [Cyanobacteriota bacterium]